MSNKTKIGIYQNQEGYDQGKTTVPSFIVKSKNIKHGDDLIWNINEIGQIVVTPKSKD